MASKKSTKTDNDMTMKIFVVVALVIAFVGGYLIATKYKSQLQEPSKMVLDKDAASQQMKSYNNKIMMKDGKMWVVENGRVKEMDSDVMMPSGDKVMMNGKVMRADGTDIMMRNGEAIDMDGKMMSSGAN